MKVYIIRERSGIKAKGEYDPATRSLTVLRGSVLSATITYTEKFRGAKSIEKSRAGVLKENVLQKDVAFKSASTAANFVTGTSTNGLTAWKDKEGKSIKEYITEAEGY